ncbi:bZIP transcription factor [Stagonosporopsis vannaccii]|nr:bZIP transcription factor [Stagonosporopsis vannaccii]
MSRTIYPSIRSDTGYNMQQPAAQDHTKPTIEMSLREHLLAAGAGQPSAPSPIQQQQPHTGGPQQHIDPAIAGSQHYMSQADPNDDAEGRKGRRELSTSKRAAQNRAAQRAFRQRKEEYIKQLKDQVKEFEHLCELYKNLQTENYQLRDYIINLQSRLLETQGEVPPAPAGVDLSNRPHAELPSLNPNLQQQQHQQQPDQQQSQQQSPGSGSTGGLSERQIGELQMAAQAAAAAQNGPSAGKHAGQFDAGDYSAEKRTKVEGDASQGQQSAQSPLYADPNAY